MILMLSSIAYSIIKIENWGGRVNTLHWAEEKKGVSTLSRYSRQPEASDWTGGHPSLAGLAGKRVLVL